MYSITNTGIAQADSTITHIDSESIAVTSGTTIDANGNGISFSAGDLLMVYISEYAATSTDNHVTITAPAGWHTLGSGTHGTNNGAMFWRIVPSTRWDGATTFTASVSGYMSATIVSFGNVDPANPIAQFAGGNDGASSTSHSTPTVTATRSSQWAVAAFSDATSTGTSAWSTPSGYTQLQNTASNANGTNAKNRHGMYRSNSGVTPGSVSVTTSTNVSSATANSFIALLNPKISGASGTMSASKVVLSNQNAGASANYDITVATPLGTTAKCIKLSFDSWAPTNSTSSLPYGMAASSPALTSSTAVTGASWGTGTVTNNYIKWTYSTGQAVSTGVLHVTGITNPLRDEQYAVMVQTFSDTGCSSELDATVQSYHVYDPISYVGSKQTLVTSAGTSISMALPSSSSTNDLAIAVISLTTADTITPPAGWTALQSTSGSQASGIWYRKLTSSDSWPYSFTWTSSTTASGVVSLYHGTDITTPIANNTNLTSESSGTTHTTSAITMSAGQWLVGIYADKAACGQWTAPSGYYEHGQASANTPRIQIYDANANKGTGSQTLSATTGSSCAANLLSAVSLNPNTTEIQFVSTTKSNQNVDGSDNYNGIMTILRPDRVVAGQLMLVAVGSVDGRQQEPLAGPAGWQPMLPGRKGSDLVTVFWKVATNDEPASYQFTRESFTKMAGVLTVYANTDQYMPIDRYSSGPDSQTAKNHDSVAVNATGSREMLVAFWNDGVSTNAMTTSTTGATMRNSQIFYDPDGEVAVADFYDPYGASRTQIRGVGNVNATETASGGVTLFPAFTTTGSTLGISSVTPLDPRAAFNTSYDVVLTTPKSSTAKCITATFNSFQPDNNTSLQDSMSFSSPAFTGSSAVTAANWGAGITSGKTVTWTYATGQALSAGTLRITGIQNPRVAGTHSLLLRTYSDTGCTTAIDTKTSSFTLSDVIQRVGSYVTMQDPTDSFELTQPTGTQAGDLMVVAVTNDGSAPTTAPAGWTAVTSAWQDAVFYRVATNSETLPYAFSMPNSGCCDGIGTITSYRNVDQTTPVAATNQGDDPNLSTSHVSPSVTPTALGQWPVAAFFSANGGSEYAQNSTQKPIVGVKSAYGGGPAVELFDTGGPVTSLSSTTLTATTTNGGDYSRTTGILLLNPKSMSSYTISPSASASGAAATYTAAFSTPNPTIAKCISISYDSSTGFGTGSLPSGMTVSSPALTGSTAVTASSWGTGSISGNSVNFTNTTGEALSAGNIVMTGTTANPSGAGTYYGRVRTYTSTDCSSGLIDSKYNSYSIVGAANNAPNSPSSLAQKTTGDVVLNTGDFHNTQSIKFSATVSDTDNPDTLYLCVEKKALGVSFANSEDSCGSGVSYSGTSIAATVTISSITDATDYHWQARVKDAAGAYSSWISYGGNAESARDFGIDTTAPTGGTVYDGTSVGVDSGFNNGSLSSLSANWSGFSVTTSGLNKYQYSIGTSAGGTQILAWTDNGTTTSVNATGLTLRTGVTYYMNVRAVDNAGNTSTTVSSDGQLVAPTFTFGVSTSGLDLALTGVPANTYTGSLILTTSTNAYSGYTISAVASGLLTSGSNTISAFNGGSYASPDAWQSGDTGFGYTSSDTIVGAVNKFQAATCPGGSTLTAPGCYSPFSTSGLGDVVADHTSTVTGTPITNEQFTVSLRLTVPSTQPAGRYAGSLTFSAVPTY